MRWTGLQTLVSSWLEQFLKFGVQQYPSVHRDYIQRAKGLGIFPRTLMDCRLCRLEPQNAEVRQKLFEASESCGTTVAIPILDSDRGR